MVLLKKQDIVASFREYENILFSVQDVVSKVDVGANKVQVGVVKYANYPSVEFPLGQYQTRPEVKLAGVLCVFYMLFGQFSFKVKSRKSP
jgi:hypothetical protein